jgi:hypothetical protein
MKGQVVAAVDADVLQGKKTTMKVVDGLVMKKGIRKPPAEVGKTAQVEEVEEEDLHGTTRMMIMKAQSVAEAEAGVVLLVMRMMMKGVAGSEILKVILKLRRKDGKVAGVADETHLVETREIVAATLAPGADLPFAEMVAVVRMAVAEVQVEEEVRLQKDADGLVIQKVIPVQQKKAGDTGKQ